MSTEVESSQNSKEDEFMVELLRRVKADNEVEHLLEEHGFVRSGTDATIASRTKTILYELFEKVGVREIARTLGKLKGALASHAVYVVPQEPGGFERRYIEIVAALKGWENPQVYSLEKFISENSSKVLGGVKINPLTLLAALGEKAPNVITRDTSVSQVGASGGGSVAGVVKAEASVSKSSQHEAESSVSLDESTLREMTTLLLESVDRPTIIIVREDQLRFIPPEVLSAVSANRNFAVLVPLGKKPAPELRELFQAGKVASVFEVNSTIAIEAMRNALNAMYKELLPGPLSLDREKALKRTLAEIIKIVADSPSFKADVRLVLESTPDVLSATRVLLKHIAEAASLFTAPPTDILKAIGNTKEHAEGLADFIIAAVSKKNADAWSIGSYDVDTIDAIVRHAIYYVGRRRLLEYCGSCNNDDLTIKVGELFKENAQVVTVLKKLGIIRYTDENKPYIPEPIYKRLLSALGKRPESPEYVFALREFLANRPDRLPLMD